MPISSKADSKQRACPECQVVFVLVFSNFERNSYLSMSNGPDMMLTIDEGSDEWPEEKNPMENIPKEDQL